ncbi:MAG: Gx transporter family protein, partial [Clostridiaceae bacterium]|nr:Gx transporter family protein [Clostridiaceae bacterium]
MSTSSCESTKRTGTRHIARMGLFLAMALALSILEGFLPPLPSPVPIRYGLSNIAVMATLLFLGRREALVVAVMKS